MGNWGAITAMPPVNMDLGRQFLCTQTGNHELELNTKTCKTELENCRHLKPVHGRTVLGELLPYLKKLCIN
jgi:hypothetical protein